MTIRFTGHLTLAANFATFWTTLVFAFVAYLSGGAIISYTSWLLWIPIAMAFCFCGYRCGTVWSIVVFSCYTGMLILEHQGHKFPQVIQTENWVVGLLTTWYSGFAGVVIIGSLINYMLKQLSLIRGGNFSPLHVFLEKYGSHTPVSLSLLESYVDHALSRHEKYNDMLMFAIIKLEIDSELEDDKLAIQLEALKRINNLIRRSDLAVQMDNGRIAVVFENISTPDSALIIANSMRQLMFQPFVHGNGQIRVSPEIETRLYPDDHKDSETLTKIARQSTRQGLKPSSEMTA